MTDKQSRSAISSIDLDDPSAILRLDRDDMLGHILRLPEQLRAAWAITRSAYLPSTHSDVDSIVLLGMGGSAIGGDLVRTVVGDDLKVPFYVSRDYTPPVWIGSRTLVITSSHSGETEETLAALDLARDRGAKIVAVTTGGALLRRAQSAGFPAIQFSYRSQPRAAIGFSTILTLGVLDRLGLVPSAESAVTESAELLTTMAPEMEPDRPKASNAAKQLAEFIHGRVAVFYGGVLAEVARRWKGQLNENSKHWAFFEALPELNHNAVVAYQDPGTLNDRLAVVVLTSDYDHPRVAVRARVLTELFERYGVPNRFVAARGHSRLAQVLSACYVGDFTSYYLAALNAVDPTPIEGIDFLKMRLANS